MALHHNESGRPPCATGTLLNLCADGLALQLSAAALDAVRVGGQYRICFDLGEGEFPFELPGRVSNIVDGATPDRAVVGIEFFTAECSVAEAARLSEAVLAHQRGGV